MTQFDFIKAIGFQEEHCGKKIKMIKKRLSWIFQSQNQTHTVTFSFSLFDSKFTFKVDNHPKITGNRSLFSRIQFDISVGENKYFVEEGLVTFSLYINDMLFKPGTVMKSSEKLEKESVKKLSIPNTERRSEQILTARALESPRQPCVQFNNQQVALPSVRKFRKHNRKVSTQFDFENTVKTNIESRRVEIKNLNEDEKHKFSKFATMGRPDKNFNRKETIGSGKQQIFHERKKSFKNFPRKIQSGDLKKIHSLKVLNNPGPPQYIKNEFEKNLNQLGFQKQKTILIMGDLDPFETMEERFCKTSFPTNTSTEMYVIKSIFQVRK